MAVGIGTLVGYLVLDDKLSPALKVAQANIATTSKSLKDLGTNLQAAGSAMLPLSAAVGAFGGLALSTFADFERGMNRVRAVTGASGADFELLNKQAQDLGASTVFTAREAAEAMGFFGLAGFEVTEIYKAMPGALQLASAGQLQVGQAADTVAKIMRGYAIEADNVGQINDVLVKAFTKANTDLLQLGEGFKHAGPVAKQFGIQFEETAATLALMADAGFQGSLGGTSLRNALLRLQGVLPESAKLLKQMGLETQDASGKLLPLADIIEQVEQKGIKAEEMMRLLGVRGGPAMLSVIERGSGELRKFTKMLEESGGTAERIEKIQLEGLKGQWVLLTSAVEGAAIALGGAMAPAVGRALGPLTSLANFVRDDVVPAFMELPQSVQTGMVGMLGVLTAAGPVLFGLGASVKALGFAFDGLKVGFSGAVKGIELMKAGITGTSALMTTFAKVNASAFGGFIPAIQTVGAELALLFPKLTLLAKGVGVVGAAFAGWQVGTWISDLKLFGEEQMSVGESFSFGLLKLQQWTGFLDASDADIENSILAQRNLGKEVENTAKAFTDAEVAALSYEQCVAELVTPTEQAVNMTDQWNQEMAALQVTVMELTQEQRTAIQTGLAMNKSVEDIAAGLGLAEDAVKSYAAGYDEANTKVDEFLEKQRKSAEETAKLRNELAALTVQQTGTEQDARLAQIDEWFNNEVAAIEGVGEAYEQHYAALQQLRDARRAAELSNIAEMNSLSLEALQQQAEKERRTYDDMLSSGLTFSREVLEKQLAKVRELEQAVRDYGHAWTSTADETRQAAQAANEFFDHMGDSVEETLRRMGKLKEAVTETFTMDIQPLTKTQIRDIQGDMDLHGQLTGADPTTALLKKLQQLEELEGTYAPKSAEQYKQMIDDQVLLSQLRMMDLEQQAQQSTQMVERETARVQSGGGISNVTTASVSGSGSRGVGGGVVMNNYINGTGQQVAQVLESQLMHTLKAGRQFGAS